MAAYDRITQRFVLDLGFFPRLVDRLHFIVMHSLYTVCFSTYLACFMHPNVLLSFVKQDICAISVGCRFAPDAFFLFFFFNKWLVVLRGVTCIRPEPSLY